LLESCGRTLAGPPGDLKQEYEGQVVIPAAHRSGAQDRGARRGAVTGIRALPRRGASETWTRRTGAPPLLRRTVHALVGSRANKRPGTKGSMLLVHHRGGVQVVTPPRNFRVTTSGRPGPNPLKPRNLNLLMNCTRIARRRVPVTWLSLCAAVVPATTSPRDWVVSGFINRRATAVACLTPP
jgi:hypothetical protein